MLERIEINDFQPHERLRIRFDPKITCIIGSSDQGKTSTLRALRWLALNRPQGTAFIRWGATSSCVKLWVDGRKVVRQRGKENTYLLDDQEYKAFGNDVPQDIANLLKVDELNYQRQHDAPFWFSLTPGQVSRELNAIINLDVMDEALSRAAAGTRKAKATAEVSQERLTKAKADRRSLMWVKEADARLREVEEIAEEVDSLTTQSGQLKELLDQIKEVQVQAEREVPSTEDMDKAAAECGQLAQEHRELLTLLSKIRGQQKCLSDLQKKAATAEAEFKRLTGKACPLCGMTRTTPS